MKKFITLSFVFLFSLSAVAKVKISGHNQTNAFMLNTDNKTLGLLHQFRLNGKKNFPKDLTLDTALDLNALLLNRSNFPSGSVTQNTFYRLGETKEFKGGDQTYLLANLDRFSLNKSFPAFDLKLGRQALSYGNLNFISPVNIFSAKPVLAFNYEYAPGIDAVRSIFPMGETTELELTHIFSKNNKFATDPSLVKLKFPSKSLSNELVLAHYSQNQMIGLSSQVFFDRLELLSDLTYTFRKDYFNYFRGTWGLTYYFSPESIVKLEYHYNTPEKVEILAQESIVSYDYTRAYLRRKHYFHLSWQKSFESLSSLSIVNKIVPEDELWQVLASFTYNQGNDLDFLASGGIPLVQKRDIAVKEFAVLVLGVKKYF